MADLANNRYPNADFILYALGEIVGIHYAECLLRGRAMGRLALKPQGRLFFWKTLVKVLDKGGWGVVQCR